MDKGELSFGPPKYTIVQNKNKNKRERTPETEAETQPRSNRPYVPAKCNKKINQGQEPTPTNYDNRGRAKYPAPIITKCHLRIYEKTCEYGKKNYTVKYTRNNTSEYFDDIMDKLAFQEVSISSNTEFYTYTERLDKQHAYVMRGLVTDLTEAEITDLLQEKLPGIKKIYTMRNKMDTDNETDTDNLQHKNNKKLYMVITDNSIELSDVSKIKTVHYTRDVGAARKFSARNSMPQVPEMGARNFKLLYVSQMNEMRGRS